TQRALRTPKVDISRKRRTPADTSCGSLLAQRWRDSDAEVPDIKHPLVTQTTCFSTGIMPTKHLGSGSEQPAKQADKLRLYGMRFCPYVQRIRIVLNAKGLDYDEVFVDLKDKPEWLFKMHPKGLVPVLDTGDKIVIESLDIADFLEEKYPQPALYPNSERKAEDKALIEKFGKVAGAIGRAFHDKENKPVQEFLNEVTDVLADFEVELNKRGTTFFSGEKPGMVDYMIWPWTERSKLPALLKEQEFNFPKEKFPKLVAWRQAIQEDAAVKPTIIEADKHLRFIKVYVTGKGEYLDDEF
ncbi:Pyrimidodiazepine synthase, partial [Gryllus bimaculatus]